ncbi:hypothetical protein RRG08_026763 [Elysia crispata]|uniref:Uncharacterized protein n=1 Tax=Elysia crispata TaxID=231223 RepID=A0AAE1AQJ1_9GAST|nr:hypothetical protein RRG08_026763 [Elysia crispata]
MFFLVLGGRTLRSISETNNMFFLVLGGGKKKVKEEDSADHRVPPEQMKPDGRCFVSQIDRDLLVERQAAQKEEISGRDTAGLVVCKRAPPSGLRWTRFQDIHKYMAKWTEWGCGGEGGGMKEGLGGRVGDDSGRRRGRWRLLITLNLITLNLITLNLITLNLITLNLITLNLITLNLITLNLITLNFPANLDASARSSSLSYPGHDLCSVFDHTL